MEDQLLLDFFQDKLQTEFFPPTRNGNEMVASQSSRFIMGSVSPFTSDISEIYHCESRSERLARKLRDSPFLGVGLMGLMAVCALGAHRFNSRPVFMSASQYLMQLRVTAQGTVVGSLLLSLAYRDIFSRLQNQ